MDLELLVLQQFRKANKRNEKWTKILNYKSSHTNAHTGVGPLFREREPKCFGRGNWWWEPPKGFIPAAFCSETSINGLRYVSQPKRHLCERIFWVIIFVISVSAAIILINNVWSSYYENPVVVTLSPTVTHIDELPFPAITICSQNKFPRSGVEARLKMIADAKAGANVSEEAVYIAKEEIKMINAACTGQKSFAKSFGFAENRGKIDDDLIAGELDTESRLSMGNFLLDNTLPCDHLIRFCVWSEQVVPCLDFFKAVATDYGKCCTFNMLPEVLMFNSRLRRRNLKRENYTYIPRYTNEEVNMWNEWNYKDDGFILKRHLKKPVRQLRAGLRQGLSVLVDPNLNDNFCTLSDSVGFRLQLHTPLEFPHLQDFGTIIGLKKEVFVQVHPELTVIRNDIKEYDINVRKCAIGNEIPTDFYKPYTADNCVDDCVSKQLINNCNCAEYYMPRNNETETCNTNGESKDFKCARKTLDNVNDTCSYCLPLCQKLSYNFEVTSSRMHKASTLWGDNKIHSHPKWMDNKMTILHIYMGVDSTVPKLRRKLYEISDLIANTGGVLSLCLGVSVLSLVEILYFTSLRAFWEYRRQKAAVKKLGNKFLGYMWKSKDNDENINTFKKDEVFQFQPSNFYTNMPHH